MLRRGYPDDEAQPNELFLKDVKAFILIITIHDYLGTLDELPKSTLQIRPGAIVA